MVILIYRCARWLHLRGVPVLPKFLKIVNRIVFGVVLPPSAELGKNVLLSYQGLGTVVHKRARIGDDVVLGTNVTVGGRSGHREVPVLERGVSVGTGAKVLGPVTIGEHATIGANAVVITDIPAYAVAVGVPARVVRIQQPSELVDYREGLSD
jgi:serine O-acetyltransferase